MKVIFSRKGFDSRYGGIASPILPDGRILPLPIPSNHDKTTLADLRYPDVDWGGLIADLSNNRHSLATPIHLDPDLCNTHAAKLAGWRPALGQTGAAQNHLHHQQVGAGDVFLFFGWFRLAERFAGHWRFAPGAPDLHVIFGWLEIDDVLPIVTYRDDSLRRHPWIATHPHVVDPGWYSDTRNTLYIARERSLYARNEMAGGGIFPMMRPALQLTKPGATRSVWSLPTWFMPHGRPPLTYHWKPEKWRADEGRVTLQSSPIGQEFVIDGTAYPELEPWVENLIGTNT